MRIAIVTLLGIICAIASVEATLYNSDATIFSFLS